MKYMLLIYLDENTITQDQRDQCYKDSAAYACKLQLQPPQPLTAALMFCHRTTG